MATVKSGDYLNSDGYLKELFFSPRDIELTRNRLMQEALAAGYYGGKRSHPHWEYVRHMLFEDDPITMQNTERNAIRGGWDSTSSTAALASGQGVKSALQDDDSASEMSDEDDGESAVHTYMRAQARRARRAGRRATAGARQKRAAEACSVCSSGGSSRDSGVVSSVDASSSSATAAALAVAAAGGSSDLLVLCNDCSARARLAREGKSGGAISRRNSRGLAVRFLLNGCCMVPGREGEGSELGGVDAPAAEMHEGDDDVPSPPQQGFRLSDLLKN